MPAVRLLHRILCYLRMIIINAIKARDLGERLARLVW